MSERFQEKDQNKYMYGKITVGPGPDYLRHVKRKAMYITTYKRLALKYIKSNQDWKTKDWVNYTKSMDAASFHKILSKNYMPIGIIN